MLGFARLVPVRVLRPQTCSTWLGGCNELGDSAAAVHKALSCSCSCDGAPRPRQASATAPRRVLRARGSTRATFGCIGDAHSTRGAASARGLTNQPGTLLLSRAMMPRACEQCTCIMCAPWTDRASVREVLCENWVTLLRARPCTAYSALPRLRNRLLGTAALESRLFRIVF